jgi:nucleotide-binding universal stress UspA family protein
VTLRSEFLAFDGRLARAGVPPLTKWWRDGIGKWLDAYESRECLELWACVGRGAAKSTALYKLCAFFAVHVEWAVPRGERHFAIVLSRLKEEAAKGIDIIAAWLSALGVPHHVVGDVIELDEMRRGIRVVAASVAATSGWRAFFVGQDERSKWALSGVEEHDAEEIDTSATAMTATHALAVKVTVGSAWGQFGGFFDVVTAGSNVERVVLGPAATWTAAPHITEASCRKKERDPRRFAREYQCIFQADGLGVFDADAIERAMDRKIALRSLGQAELIIDPSSGKADAWAWAVVRWVDDMTGRYFLKVELIDAVEGKFWEQRSSDEIVARVASVARDWGVTRVYSDQREAFTLRSAFLRHNLRFHSIPWTSSEVAEGSKPRAIALVRRWLADDVLILPRDERLKRELLGMQEKFSPSGALTYGARGSAHDDRAAVLITAAMVDLARRLKLPAAATQRPRPKLPLQTLPPWEERPIGDYVSTESNSLGPSHQQFVTALVKHGWLTPR